MTPIIVALVVVVVVVVVVVAAGRRRRTDDIASFRRQIDALSPEARRPTIDQVRRVEEDSGETGENDS